MNTENSNSHNATLGRPSRDAAHVAAGLRAGNMADAEAAKALSGLLSGISQRDFHNKAEVTEELLNTQLFPELSREQFAPLHDRMRGLLKVPQRQRHTLT